MKVLSVLHHPDEGPGTLGSFFSQKGVELQDLRPFTGQAFPETVQDLDAVILMGGPMNVYQHQEHPWLKEENSFVKRLLEAGVPILGICLGSQLIAKALGAAVVDSPQPEIGWFQAELTPEGRDDPLFAGVGPTLEVFQWHNDMFQIPAGGSLLARAEGCPHQALRWGQAWGLQFHQEVDRQLIAAWSKDDPRQQEMLDGFDRQGPAMMAQGQRIFENFWNMLAG